MKAAVLAMALTASLAGLAGCQHLDVASEGRRARVLTGTINTGVPLPAGTEISVRLIARVGAMPGQPPVGDQPVVRQTAGVAEQIVGEQVQKLTAPAAEAVPFRLEYDADDALLRHGLNVEARVYYNGRVRFRTVNAHVVTLSSSPYPQTVVLQPVDR